MLRPKFQSLLFSLTEQEIQNTWNVLSSKIQTFESKAHKKECLYSPCIMHNYFSSGKAEMYSCVLSWGFPPQMPRSDWTEALMFSIILQVRSKCVYVWGGGKKVEG